MFNFLVHLIHGYPYTISSISVVSDNKKNIQGGREISVIIVTDDYLCYKKPKSPYNFFLILIFNELFKFKTSDQCNGNIIRSVALLWEWKYS